MNKVFLKRNKESAVLRKHPWVFSGAIHKVEGEPQEGEIVEVRDSNKKYLGRGHFQEKSIRVRILTFQEEEIDQIFWNKTISKAFDYRCKHVLPFLQATNSYRLIHGEGDNLSGLVIDIYNKTAVIQCHSVGMYLQRKMISEALLNAEGLELDSVYSKCKTSISKHSIVEAEDELLHGSSSSDTINEYGNLFHVDWQEGQKTGFFLDQRENRKLLGRLAKGKKVLNTFCYSGGFSIYALKSGASLVHSVDVSKKAMEWTDQNVRKNGEWGEKHESFCTDVNTFFQQNDRKYDIVIVDPPAFAKNFNKRHQAVIGYKNLNTKAIDKVEEGGLLFTFSCSQVVDDQLFYNTIVAAALEKGRKARVMYRLSQPPDHPVSLFHPEGSYLKGLVVRLD